MTVRRLCVVTGTRAEYGILYWLLYEVRADPRFELQIVVTGSHLSPEFGLTHRAIEADGFVIDRKIEVLLSSDTPVGVSKGVGLGVIGFADAFDDLEPDIVLVLGDRFEILAATQAAFFAGIPVGHISGGELTFGALDDGIRHAITKLSRYHFVAAEAYRRRVIQLGESPDRVFNVGDPGLDNVVRLELLDRETLTAALGLNVGTPFFLATYHPVTAGSSDPALGMRAMLRAMDAFPTHQVVLTHPNADAGGRALTQVIDEYAASRRERVKTFTSLGQLRYLSAMKHCAVVVGNSSSGIVEAPAMHKPTVNIGPRQSGRLRTSSIIDCEERDAAIEAALTEALSISFGHRAMLAESAYGNCNASAQIRGILAAADITRCYAKRFHDLHD